MIQSTTNDYTLKLQHFNNKKRENENTRANLCSVHEDSKRSTELHEKSILNQFERNKMEIG